MGFKAWSKLSVLVLAGAALVGCQNGQQREKKLLGATPGNPPPTNAFTNTPQGAFPTAKDNYGAPNGVSPASNRSNPAFGTPPGSGGGIPPMPTFPPMNNTTSKGASSSFAPTDRNPNLAAPSNPALPVPNTSNDGIALPKIPSAGTTFGTGNGTSTTVNTLPGGSSPPITPPADWNK